MSTKFDLNRYPINYFRERNSYGFLKLSPKYQRRKVWQPKAKSFLIDTILRGLPIPPIFMREQLDKSHNTIIEIIDGQQRMRAILEYVEEGFIVSKIHNKDYGGLFFSNLPEEVQDDFLSYNIATNIVRVAEDDEILELFARINSYSLTLNNPEKLNAKYFGFFKQTTHSLAFKYNKFWLNSNILTERHISRMLDVELSSDLLIYSITRLFNRKLIAQYYKDYDNDFPNSEEIINNFEKCIDTISQIFGDILPTSIFQNIPLFYSLYTVIYNLLFNKNNDEISINKNNFTRIKNILEELESEIDNYLTDKKSKDSELIKFIDNYTKHTTDVSRRQERHEFLEKYIIDRIKYE